MQAIDDRSQKHWAVKYQSTVTIATYRMTHFKVPKQPIEHMSTAQVKPDPQVIPNPDSIHAPLLQHASFHLPK